MLRVFWWNTSNSYACGYWLILALFIENSIFSPMYILSTFVEDQCVVYNLSILFIICICFYVNTFIIKKSNSREKETMWQSLNRGDFYWGKKFLKRKGRGWPASGDSSRWREEREAGRGEWLMGRTLLNWNSE